MNVIISTSYLGIWFWAFLRMSGRIPGSAFYGGLYLPYYDDNVLADVSAMLFVGFHVGILLHYIYTEFRAK